MKLGISTYTLTWSIGVPGYDAPKTPLTAAGLLQKAKECGVKLVQFADNLPLHRLNDNELRQIKTTAHQSGISIEVGTRGTEPEHLLKYLEICRLLDSKIFRTLITSTDLGQAENDLNHVLPSFIEADVSIAIENHGLHTAKQLISLFESINSPYLGSCLDTVNSFSALESPDHVIKQLVPHIINLHIKDFEIKRADHQMGFAVLGTPAGYGRLDIHNLLKTIEREGKRPTAILELWTPFSNSVEETIQKENEWLHQSLDFLKQLNFE